MCKLPLKWQHVQTAKWVSLSSNWIIRIPFHNKITLICFTLLLLEKSTMGTALGFVLWVKHCFFVGFWRILEIDYREGVVVRILNLLDENSWSYDRVPFEQTCDILKELEPRYILNISWICVVPFTTVFSLNISLMLFAGLLLPIVCSAMEKRFQWKPN